MSIHLACIYCDLPAIETISLPPGWKPDHLTLLTRKDIEAMQRQYDELRKPSEPRRVVDWDSHGTCPACWEKQKPKPWEPPVNNDPQKSLFSE